MVSELGIAQKLVELVPAGRFCIQCGMAIPLPGYTIITTPFENENKWIFGRMYASSSEGE